MKHLLVVGSINIDFIVQLDNLPRTGDICQGKELQVLNGGKGANQALAARKLGAPVCLLAKVGDDPRGPRYRDFLEQSGIIPGGIELCPGKHTGYASVYVDGKGQSQIVVAQGANGCLFPEDLEAKSTFFDKAQVVLAQAEIPLETILKAREMAQERKIPFVFSPSPFPPEFPWGKVRLDYLILSERKCQELCRIILPKTSLARDREKLLELLAEKVADHIVLTRREHGAAGWIGGRYWEEETLTVKVADALGAGDAFSGAFCVALMEGKNPADTLRWANYAASLSVTQPGPQTGFPSRTALFSALERFPRNP